MSARFKPVACVQSARHRGFVASWPQFGVSIGLFFANLAVRASSACRSPQLSSVIAGGPTPLVAAWLLGRFHAGTAIAFFILFSAVVSLLATAALPDRTNKDIEPDDAP